MKLYTKSGDDGMTGLFGAGRVPKDHPRVEAYGTVDELNAAVGLCASAPETSGSSFGTFTGIFQSLQSRLFEVGADLATPADSKHEGKIRRIEAADVREIEQWIDQVDDRNQPMEAFVLPGGSDLAARLHLARTICRRAERRVIALARREPVNDQLMILLNRIGDLLFAMARLANRETGVDDIVWKPRHGDQ